MIVRPMIGDWELPCIERVELHQARRQVRLGVPGLLGDLHQDLGVESLAVTITGSLSGAETRSGFLEALQEQFRSGDPVPFVADIVESSELEDVVIVSFDVVETDEWVDAVRYRIVVRQYVEPPEPPPLVPELPLDDLAGLADLAGNLLDGLDLPALLGGVPALADPSEPIRPALGTARDAVADVPALLGGLREALGMPA
ncbi:hypothetical protein OG558_35860 [Kribbella sp. NBC_01510]|jgi:hypothetical protein|uniref:hypothetical protein n=1 Tax=Kribbella sp. NBC_01510 TaxID=2903581 RepID=UPI00386813D4